MSSSSSVSETARRLASTGSSVAVLLVGDEGGSQLGVATELCKAWHCLTPADGAACGECKACGAFDRGATADYMLLEPTGPQDLIRLRQIVDDPVAPEPNVRSFLQSPPAVGRNRVVLIDRADRLTNDSANALLKTVEEPSQSARFVLTTSASGRILPTIRSRCVLVPCGSESLPEGFAAACSGGSAEVYERLSAAEFSEFLHAFEVFVANCDRARRTEALALADEFLELSAAYVGLRDGPGEERQKRAEFIRLFANVTGTRASENPRWRGLLERSILVHRALLGNVNAAYLADWLFAGFDLTTSANA
jgi:hypothetical protein